MRGILVLLSSPHGLRQKVSHRKDTPASPHGGNSQRIPKLRAPNFLFLSPLPHHPSISPSNAIRLSHTVPMCPRRASPEANPASAPPSTWPRSLPQNSAPTANTISPPKTSPGVPPPPTASIFCAAGAEPCRVTTRAGESFRAF